MSFLIRKNKLFIFLFFFCSFGFCFAQEDSPDAIAMRIIQNPRHLSAQSWYIDNNFSGSPQSLMVDGYEAVRDGRTVYVNAANVGVSFYTNIYLISYNQQAERKTQDIFGQIIKHWKFNTNIIGEGLASGECVGKDGSNGNNCVLDKDCGIDEYCNSRKAMVRRDVRRLADLREIQILLEDYFGNHEEYPMLSAGTYQEGKTVSVWPSWQETFARELGKSLPIDPINKLENCNLPYDSTTCWSEDNKSFDGSVPDDLNEGSRVYSYDANDGESYKLCAELEVGEFYNNLPNNGHYCLP